MLTLDLSKVVPRTAFTYVAALVPGLFFELSILLGSPDVVAEILRKPQAFNLTHYEVLFVGLFFAFVIGTAGMFLVCPLIQTLVGFAYRFVMFAWDRCRGWLLVPLGKWFLKRQFWQKKFWRRPWAFNLFRYVNDKTFPFESTQILGAYRCWRELARKLLKEQYGIELEELGEEWVWLYWHLGLPTGEEVRGYVLAIASHATGWAGLAALLLAPALRNRYFVGFCILLVVVGLHHDYYVARRRYDPIAIAIVRIRALLRECAKTRGATIFRDERVRAAGPPTDGIV
jgi:hypothetical protein